MELAAKAGLGLWRPKLAAGDRQPRRLRAALWSARYLRLMARGARCRRLWSHVSGHIERHRLIHLPATICLRWATAEHTFGITSASVAEYASRGSAVQISAAFTVLVGRSGERHFPAKPAISCLSTTHVGKGNDWHLAGTAVATPRICQVLLRRQLATRRSSARRWRHDFSCSAGPAVKPPHVRCRFVWAAALIKAPDYSSGCHDTGVSYDGTPADTRG